MNNFLLKNINIDVGSKCQTWQELYHPGSKRAKSNIQITLDKKSEKLKVYVSSQTADMYIVKETYCKKNIIHFFPCTDFPNGERLPVYIAQITCYTIGISQW